MKLPISFNVACASRSPVASRQPGEGRACGNTSDSPHKEKQKRQADRKHGVPPAERDADDDSVMGEVEQPPPPSEKPEAS